MTLINNKRLMITDQTLNLISQLRPATHNRIVRILPILCLRATQGVTITYGELAIGDIVLPNKFGYVLGKLAAIIESLDDNGQHVPPLTTICVNQLGAPGASVVNVLHGEPWQDACDRVFAYDSWHIVQQELMAVL
jgi:hypothetical protein